MYTDKVVPRKAMPTGRHGATIVVGTKKRHSSGDDMAEPKRGELPWDQLDGSARPGKALWEAAKEVWDTINSRK